MTDTESQINCYFTQLISKHPNNALKIREDLQRQLQTYQVKIQNGEYSIRQRQIAEPKEENPKDKLKEILKNKKDLQAHLVLLESKLQKLSDSQIRAVESKKKLTEEEHDRFIKEITKERKELERKRIEKLKEQELRDKKEQQERKARQQQQKIERERKKRQELEEKLNSLHSKREKRQSEILLSNKTLESVINSKPLYQKIESKYIHQESVSLQQKKRKLAEIRALHKPINHQEFEEHQTRIKQMKQKIMESKQSLKHERSTSVPEVYKSLWYRKVKEDNSAQEEAERARKQADRIKQSKVKVKKYSMYVKSNFKPEVDEKKAISIVSNTSSANQIRPDEHRRIGLEYLKYSKQHISNRPMTQLNVTQDSEKKAVKPTNYLQELKRKRVVEDDKTQLENLLRNPINNDKEKTQKVLERIQKLQEKAMRKQKVSKANNHVINEELDQMYMNAIKAKLALLK